MTSHDNTKIRVLVLEFKSLIFTGGLIPSTKRRDLETDTEFGIITIYHNIIFVDFLALNLSFNADVGNGAVEDCRRFLVSKKTAFKKTSLHPSVHHAAAPGFDVSSQETVG